VRVYSEFVGVTRADKINECVEKHPRDAARLAFSRVVKAVEGLVYMRWVRASNFPGIEAGSVGGAKSGQEN